MTLSPSQLHPYQHRLSTFIADTPRAMAWVDMGLGKTIATLTAFLALQDTIQTFGALVLAPLRVCELVWEQEIAKWEHTKHLTVSRLYGPPKQRRAGLQQRADVYLLNYDNLTWFLKELFAMHQQGFKPPFNLLILDEITKLKHATSQRAKAVWELLPLFPRRIGLTGAPAPNGYIDLHGQYLQLDDGQRLGTSITQFKERFFRPVGYNQYSWAPLPHTKEIIEKKIQDITIQLSAKDYLDLPDVLHNDVWVRLPDKAMEQYQQLEQQFFMELDSGATIDVVNSAALSNKCLQQANGAVYPSSGSGDVWFTETHQIKLDAVDEILDTVNSPVLLAYSFRHDAHRLLERFPSAVWFDSSMKGRKLDELVKAWQSGNIPLLMGHPDSIGFGLNAFYGVCNNIVWFGLPWRLDLYDQFNDRLTGGLRRLASNHPIMIHHILAEDTLDLVTRDTLKSKTTTQQGLREAIKRYQDSRLSIHE